MNNKALVVIDIQNDITKHYRDIIGNINAAIEWASHPSFPPLSHGATGRG